jgi:pyruvate carboxylase subunit B
MELIACIGDRRERLQVERDGERFEVRIGERTYRGEVVASGDGPPVRLLSVLVDGRQFEVGVLPLAADRYRVTTGGTGTEVELLDPLVDLTRQSHGGAVRQRSQTVAAYMPGRVVEVLVEEGQEVAAGQGVVVLEAMKMQNEIQAENAGTIRRVFVQAGQAVEGGDPLFELE